jgi:hypothetical protein
VDLSAQSGAITICAAMCEKVLVSSQLGGGPPDEPAATAPSKISATFPGRP